MSGANGPPGKKVGLLPHAAKPEAQELAPKVTDWLRSRGHEVRADDLEAVDLLVVLGGDGTMLHGVRVAGLAGVPILGVNMGLLGFLTEVGPDALYDALERTLAGEHSLDERSTVLAEIQRVSGEVQALGEGINEVGIERAIGGKVLRMSLTVGGQPFTSLAADGILIATPTGSTAYAFSMRGPVVDPSLRCLVLVGVGAHALWDRPAVVTQPVEVGVRHRGRGVIVLDGNVRGEIGAGDVLRARVGPSVVRFVRLGQDTFLTRLAQKFNLPPA